MPNLRSGGSTVNGSAENEPEPAAFQPQETPPQKSLRVSGLPPEDAERVAEMIPELREELREVREELREVCDEMRALREEVSTPRDPDRLLDAEEVADLLGVCRRTVDTLRAAGELPSIKVGRTRRYPRGAIEAYIERKLEEGA
jgi:excisionase family DNA binding protein